MSRIVAIIPARYESTRFPGKPLASICGKPMIQWVYEAVKKNQSLNDLYVATDDKRIEAIVNGFGGNTIMTSNEHKSGTDRICECVDILGLKDDDIVLNVQGDEPLIKVEMIDDLIEALNDSSVVMGTLKERIKGEEDLNNPNIVKVITDLNGKAIYFSRSIIPYKRSSECTPRFFRHVGVYAYRVHFLKKWKGLQRGYLEMTESLEQLRALENGYNINVRETQFSSLGVDTPEQLRIVEKMIETRAGMVL